MEKEDTAVHTTKAPDRTLEQRMQALARANTIRKDRARIKRDLEAGERRIADLIANPPDVLATAKVADIILAAPMYGPVRTSTLLRTLRISPSKTIGGLSDRQRHELVRELQAREQQLDFARLRRQLVGEIVLTDLQEALLRLADDSPGINDEGAAFLLDVDRRSAARTRRTLQQLGLLDDHVRPTMRGFKHLRSIEQQRNAAYPAAGSSRAASTAGCVVYQGTPRS